MVDKDRLSQFVATVERDLRSQASIESIQPYDPVEVGNVPAPWQLLGTGNYAAVFVHPDYADLAVKIYAPGRPGFEDEVEVYRKIGSHAAFSQCFYARDNFLVLKRLQGTTLYDCLERGIRIPVGVILDVDRALEYARSRGLNPRDIHGKNVIMHEGRGLVVDISDFLEEGPGAAWKDLKRFYYWIYRPLLSPAGIRIPLRVLDSSRAVYRWSRTLSKRKA